MPDAPQGLPPCPPGSLSDPIQAAIAAIEGEGSITQVRVAMLALLERFRQEGLRDRSAPLALQDQLALAELHSDAALLLSILAELLDPAREADIRIEFSRRRGRPVTTAKRRKQAWDAVELVERLISEGNQQEWSIWQARDATGLSRAEIFLWLTYSRKVQGKSPPDFVRLF